MSREASSRATTRRARRSFWVLLGVAVLATGSLSAALEAPTGPTAGLRLAGSGLVLVAAMALLMRLSVALERVRRGGVDPGPRSARRRFRV